jgi:hypothetical protein
MAFNPLKSPADYVLLGGKRTPGFADISGAELKRRLDIRQQYGATGAIVVFRGRELCRFDISLRLYEEQHFVDWEAFRPVVERDPRRGLPKGALDIWHPVLEGLSVTAVLIEKVSAPEQTDDGEWTVKIGCLEYRPPMLALAKPVGSKSSPAPDPVDQRIEQLIKQFQELAGPG